MIKKSHLWKTATAFPITPQTGWRMNFQESAANEVLGIGLKPAIHTSTLIPVDLKFEAEAR